MVLSLLSSFSIELQSHSGNWEDSCLLTNFISFQGQGVRKVGLFYWNEQSVVTVRFNSVALRKAKIVCNRGLF